MQTRTKVLIAISGIALIGIGWYFFGNKAKSWVSGIPTDTKAGIDKKYPNAPDGMKGALFALQNLIANSSGEIQADYKQQYAMIKAALDEGGVA